MSLWKKVKRELGLVPGSRHGEKGGPDADKPKTETMKIKPIHGKDQPVELLG